MPTTAEASTRTARIESLCLELRDFLGSVKKSIDDEILAYPKPIPRCDAQFNHLYEQRSRLSRILARANALSMRNDGSSELVDTLAEFAASAPFTEDVLEQALKERMRAALLGPNPFNADSNRRALGRAGGAG